MSRRLRPAESSMMQRGTRAPIGSIRPDVFSTPANRRHSRTVHIMIDTPGTTSGSPDHDPVQPTIGRSDDPYLTEERGLHFDGMVNARDLGGLPLSSGGVSDCGRLVRSASPQLLTQRGAEQLWQYGIRTVVDLRTTGEQQREGHGPLNEYYQDGRITHVDAPLLSDDSWATDPVGTPAALGDPAAHYISYLANGPTTVRIASEVASTAAQGGSTLLHCAFGKDRTGVITAVLLDVVGVGHEAIVNDYHATSRNLPALIQRFRGARSYFRDLSTPDPAAMDTQPEGIAGMLRWLSHTYGGSAGYLTHHGADTGLIVALRRHLTYLPERA